MLSRISFLLLTLIVVLSVLQYLDVETRVSAVDHRIAALNSSIARNFETLEVSPPTESVDAAEPGLIVSAVDFVERLLERRTSEATGEAHSVPASAEGPLTVQRGGWIVQVAAFSDAANADRMVKRLRDQQFEPWTIDLDGGLYAVRLGAFKDRNVAESVVHSVEASTGLSVLLIQTRR